MTRWKASSLDFATIASATHSIERSSSTAVMTDLRIS